MNATTILEELGRVGFWWVRQWQRDTIRGYKVEFYITRNIYRGLAPGQKAFLRRELRAATSRGRKSCKELCERFGTAENGGAK